MDAQVAYGFHHLRDEKPYLAQGPVANKVLIGTLQWCNINVVSLKYSAICFIIIIYEVWLLASSFCWNYIANYFTEWAAYILPLRLPVRNIFVDCLFHQNLIIVMIKYHVMSHRKKKEILILLILLYICWMSWWYCKFF